MRTHIAKGRFDSPSHQLFVIIWAKFADSYCTGEGFGDGQFILECEVVEEWVVANPDVGAEGTPSVPGAFRVGVAGLCSPMFNTEPAGKTEVSQEDVSLLRGLM